MGDTRIPRLRFAAQLGVSPRTLDRWREHGCRGVKLVPEMIGGRFYYRMDAYRVWQEKVRAARVKPHARVAIPPRADKRRLEAVQARLERRGMKV